MMQEKKLRKPRWPVAFAASAALALGVGVYGWATQSGYFAFLPDQAHPTVNAVTVPGGKPPAPGSGFYFVDVKLLQANLIEKYWAQYLVHGASLVPDKEVLAPGQSETQRVHEDYQAMATSQQTAQVVAERAAGLPVQLVALGAQITEVQPHLPAAKAGMAAGDIVTAVDGKKVANATQMSGAMSGLKPGESVRLKLSSGKTLTVATVADPQDKKRAIIGVFIGDAVHIGRIPVHVKFSTSGIGGPSAGLAFSLDIYDSLTGRKLLHGNKVAVTGELALNGSVIPIGGVKQKTIGAIEAGAQTFVVPQGGGNCRDAKAAAGGKIKIACVTSFDQARAVIRALPAR